MQPKKKEVKREERRGIEGKDEEGQKQIKGHKVMKRSSLS